MKKTKLLISILLSILLILTMTACSSNTESESETETGTETTKTTETPAEYDIASNLQVTEDGDVKSIDTDHFTLTLSHGSSWGYEINSKTMITIFNIASHDADYGGRLVSIEVYDADDKEYEEMLPSYSVIGEKDGKVYVAEYPTDVQWDHEDAQAEEDYRAVYEEVNKIRDGSGDSPIVLK